MIHETDGYNALPDGSGHAPGDGESKNEAPSAPQLKAPHLQEIPLAQVYREEHFPRTDKASKFLANYRDTLMLLFLVGGFGSNLYARGVIDQARNATDMAGNCSDNMNSISEANSLIQWLQGGFVMLALFLSLDKAFEWVARDIEGTDVILSVNGYTGAGGRAMAFLFMLLEYLSLPAFYVASSFGVNKPHELPWLMSVPAVTTVALPTLVKFSIAIKGGSTKENGEKASNISWKVGAAALILGAGSIGAAVNYFNKNLFERGTIFALVTLMVGKMFFSAVANNANSAGDKEYRPVDVIRKGIDDRTGLANELGNPRAREYNMISVFEVGLGPCKVKIPVELVDLLNTSSKLAITMITANYMKGHPVGEQAIAYSTGLFVYKLFENCLTRSYIAKREVDGARAVVM